MFESLDNFTSRAKYKLSGKDNLVSVTRITTTRAIKAGELVFKKDIKFKQTNEDKALLPGQVDDYLPAIALRDLEPDEGVTRSDMRKATIGIIVPCHMHSTRLPEKALVKIASVPSIERCLRNTLASRRAQKTVLATSTHPDDAVLENHTLNGQVYFYKGAKKDLVTRFIDAAEVFDIDIIVRVTGDSPLISYELIDLLIDAHIEAGADFSYLRDAPLGTMPEVINKNAFIRLKSLISTEDSEYLSLYFKNNPDFFSLNEVVPPEEYQCPGYRLNLDWPEDLEVLNMIFRQLGVGKEEAVALPPVLEFLRQHPEVAAINSSIKPRYIQGELAEFLKKATRISR